MNTKQTGRKYQSKEEEEAARKKIEEEARRKRGKHQEERELEEGEVVDTDSQADTQSQDTDSQGVEIDEGDRSKPPKKKKKKLEQEKSVRKISKAEHKLTQEQRDEERKRRAAAEKAAEEAKFQKLQNEHKGMLERAEALKRKVTTSATVYVPLPEGAESVVILPLDTDQPTVDPDLLETSLVESGGPLNLNPFPSEEEDEEEAAGGTRYAKSTVETKTVSQVMTEAYVHVPAENIPPKINIKSRQEGPKETT